METSILLILMLVSIIIIGFGYYKDYKKDKEYFLSGMKTMSKMIGFIAVFLLLGLVINTFSNSIFPINDDYGISKNEFRKEIGVPIIEENWRKEDSWGNQYRHWYCTNAKDSTFKHVKKKIEFDKWGAVSEEDYFESPKQEPILITLYNYDSNKIKYYVLKPTPLNQQITIDDKGKILMNGDVNKQIELSKSQFETQLIRLQSTNR